MPDKQLTRRSLLAALGISGTGIGLYAIDSSSRGENRNQPSDGDDNSPTPSPSPSTDSSPNDQTPQQQETPVVADVVEYGASVDGETDDTAAIKRAIDAAAPDGIVEFPPGEVLISPQRDLPGAITLDQRQQNVTLRGPEQETARLVMAPGQDGVHYGLHITPRTGSEDDEIRLEHLTIDLNSDKQSGVGTAIRTNGADGQLAMRDCVVTSTRNSGVKMVGGMDADIRYCTFKDNGDESYAHAITPNQTAQKTQTVIKNVYCTNQRGVSIDVGSDENKDLQTVRVEECIIKNSFGALKVDPTAASVSVTNTQMLGDAETRIPVKMNPFDFYMADIRLDNVLIDGGGWPGLDLPNRSTLQLNEVAIKNVDKNNVERGNDRGGIRTEKLDFGTSGRISIHNVGTDNSGPALKIFEGSGSIDEVIHDGTGGLGRNDGVTVARETQGGDPLEPDVVSESDVGPRTK